MSCNVQSVHRCSSQKSRRGRKDFELGLKFCPNWETRDLALKAKIYTSLKPSPYTTGGGTFNGGRGGATHFMGVYPWAGVDLGPYLADDWQRGSTYTGNQRSRQAWNHWSFLQFYPQMHACKIHHQEDTVCAGAAISQTICYSPWKLLLKLDIHVMWKMKQHQCIFLSSSECINLRMLS